MERFYSTVYTSLLRHLPFNNLKVVVLASPGFTRDSLYDYIFAEATRTGNKPLLTAKNKFVRVHVSSPHVHSLVEALKSPEVSQSIAAHLSVILINDLSFMCPPDNGSTKRNQICPRRRRS